MQGAEGVRPELTPIQPGPRRCCLSRGLCRVGSSATFSTCLGSGLNLSFSASLTRAWTVLPDCGLQRVLGPAGRLLLGAGIGAELLEALARPGDRLCGSLSIVPGHVQPLHGCLS